MSGRYEWIEGYKWWWNVTFIKLYRVCGACSNLSLRGEVPQGSLLYGTRTYNILHIDKKYRW